VNGDVAAAIKHDAHLVPAAPFIGHHVSAEDSRRAADFGAVVTAGRQANFNFHNAAAAGVGDLQDGARRFFAATADFSQRWVMSVLDAAIAATLAAASIVRIRAGGRLIVGACGRFRRSDIILGTSMRSGFRGIAP
jgi:hypothetical protein